MFEILLKTKLTINRFVGDTDRLEILQNISSLSQIELGVRTSTAGHFFFQQDIALPSWIFLIWKNLATLNIDISSIFSVIFLDI